MASFRLSTTPFNNSFQQLLSTTSTCYADTFSTIVQRAISNSTPTRVSLFGIPQNFAILLHQATGSRVTAVRPLISREKEASPLISALATSFPSLYDSPACMFLNPRLKVPGCLPL